MTIALIRQKPKRLTYLIVHFAKNWWSTTTFRKESQSLKVNLPWSVCLSYKKCQNYWGIQNGTEKVSSITSKFNILAIGENWCIDSIINIPVVHWLEKNNENIKLKVIDTDSYSKFMPNEKVITPTFIIMNQEYQEIGKWVQYPKRIIDVVESKDQVRIIVEKRRYRQGEYIVDTLEEVLDILINYSNNIYLDRRK